jgi:hypothetical protein
MRVGSPLVTPLRKRNRCDHCDDTRTSKLLPSHPLTERQNVTSVAATVMKTPSQDFLSSSDHLEPPEVCTLWRRPALNAGSKDWDVGIFYCGSRSRWYVLLIGTLLGSTQYALILNFSSLKINHFQTHSWKCSHKFIFENYEGKWFCFVNLFATCVMSNLLEGLQQNFHDKIITERFMLSLRSDTFQILTFHFSWHASSISNINEIRMAWC